MARAESLGGGEAGRDGLVLQMSQAAAVGAAREKERPAEPARRRPGWGPGGFEFVLVISLSHAVQHFYAAILPLTFPYVIDEFGVSFAELGLVIGIAGVVGGLLQGAAGLFQRVSARVMLIGQDLGLALATLLGALAPGFWLYAAARWFGTLVSWPQHPVGSALLAHRFPERRGTVLSWHTTGGSLGTLMVPMIGSILIASWGWRPALAFFALPLALGGILVFWRLRDEHGPAGAGKAQAAPTVPLVKALLRRNAVVILLASTIAAGARGLGVLNAYIPSYLKTDLGLEQVTVGFVFSVLLVGSVIGPVIQGYLGDRIGRRRILWGSYLCGAAAIASYPLVGPSIPGLLLSGALIGIFAYAETPLLQSLFSDAIQGASQRAAFGIFFAIAYGVGSLWAPAIGAIIDTWGFQYAFWVMASSFLVAALVITFVSSQATRRAT